MALAMTKDRIEDEAHDYADAILKQTFLDMEKNGKMMSENEKDMVYSSAYDLKIKQLTKGTSICLQRTW